MHLKEIVLDGFKSYAKRTVISGFDREFNAITGLNGSGKSNVLDSICFVLGISDLTQVRAKSLKELIYKQGQAGVTKASVTLIFDNSDSSASPHGYEQMANISICRQLGVAGVSKYLINGHVAQLQRVQNLFHSVQLNVNNPHFLIMQGRITKVINMKPIETLGMLEEAAGTRMFESKKQSALKTIGQKDLKLQEIERVMQEEVTPRLQKLSEQRAAYLDYNKESAEVESLGRIVQAYEYVRAKEAILKCTKEQEADVAAKEDWTTKMSAAEVEEKELQKKAKDTLARKEKESGNALAQCEEAEQEASKKLVKAAAEHESARKTQKANAETAKTIDADIKKIQSAQAKAEADMAKAKEKAQAESDKADKADKDAATKKAQYEASMGLASSSGEGVKNLQGQLSDAKDAVQNLETELKTAEMAKKQWAKELKEAEKKLAEARKSGGAHEKDHKKLLDEVSALQAKLQSLGHDETSEKDLVTQQKELQRQQGGLQRQEAEKARGLGGVDFRYSDPEKNFDRSRVKGTVASNLTVRDPVHNVALEALAGGQLHQVIVDTNITGMLLLDKGGLQRRVTLIPLNKIQPRPMASAKVQEAQKLVGGADKATLAVDLLDFDAAVSPAMQNIFGNTIVCKDDDSAKKICEKLGVKTVTLEGDLYNPSGSLTGGSRAKSGDSLLARLTELGRIRRELAAIDEQLAKVGGQLEKLHASSSEHAKLQSELEVKQQQLAIQKDKLGNSEVGVRANAVETLQQELSQAESTHASASEQLKEQQKLVKELEAQVKDFEGDRESSMKKMKAAIAQAEKECAAAKKAQKAAQAAEDKAQAALDEHTKELEEAREQKRALGDGQDKADAEIASKAEAERLMREKYEAAQEKLQQCQEALGKFDAECQAIAERREALQQLKEDGQVELSRIEHSLKRFQERMQSAEACCRELLKKHPWMEAEKDQFGVPGTEYDFAKKKPEKLQKELAAKQSHLEAVGKKINKKVLTQLERTEAEFADLMSKKEIVEKDKEKIGAVIDELAQKKIEALRSTWTKVNGDFGSIFSTLLPGNVAKLEPKPGCPVEEGLIIKVGLGEEGKGGKDASNIMWKQGLMDLSGGQKSLIALSLVLALLRFKPAPIYILDEVDSALDVQHTQNIGKMIKTYFKQSQFLVVSLKDGMFSNANVIFRTSFVDGVSQIHRDASNAEGAGSAAPKVAAAAGGKRAALTAKN